MSALSGRRVTVGVTGGIAAYKAAELVRLLVKEGAAVQCVMTRAAEQFIGRLTLQTLSGRAVAVELFDLDEESRIGHIRVADETELLVVAPATADVIARLATGRADDYLTTVALATTAPLVVAPAMNVNMWAHEAVRANVATLVERGATIVGPEAGDLACGWVGAGRLVEPAEIVRACSERLATLPPRAPHPIEAGPHASPSPLPSPSQRRETPPAATRDLAGRTLLVSAGPTREAIDPVRYLGNRSSGKMGFAIARRAAERGARVVLVAGPVALGTPPSVERVDVESAREMRDAILAREGDVDAVVMAAAVADYRPAAYSEKKLKKEPTPGVAASDLGAMSILLEKNPDILAELCARRRARLDAGMARRPLLVGFAAETGDLEAHAQAKLARKGCDLLVGNDVILPGSGFGHDTNRVALFEPGREPEHLPLMSKDEVAARILDRIVALSHR